MNNLLVPHSRKPFEQMGYYEVLGITSKQERKTVTEADLKKRYYALALKYHPDKNPEDQEASLHFQRINEAYQVLSDPKRRKLYDETGQVDVTELAVDPKAFFKQCFGGEAFEDWIGDFFVSTLIQDLGRYVEESERATSSSPQQSPNPDNFLTTERMKEYESTFEQRTTRLASNLLFRIKSYNSNDIDSCASFRATTAQECERLSKEPNAKRLLATIGYVYYTRAKKVLGRYRFLGLPSLWIGLKDTKHVVKKYFSTMYSLKKFGNQAEKSTLTLQAAQSESTTSHATHNNNEVNCEEEIDPELDMKTIEYLMKFVNNATCLEVEFALRRVMELVLERTANLSQAEVVRRGEALKIVGKMFIETSKTISEDNNLPF